ncbi:MAG: lysophospholipase [Pseudomonadota bacterium]|nr:lysophospholipase [Pseudomonadota bacterium]
MIRVALSLILATATMCHAAEEVITIPTRDGVKLSYLLVQDKSAAPKAVAISFVGGLGAIGLAKRARSGPVQFGPGTNFLIRIREQLIDADIADAIVDSPSDKLPQGMEDEFRLGPDHLADIRALIVDLKKRFPDSKIYLIGTSRGTISAAALAAKLGDSVQGAVLSSTVTNRDKRGDALSRFDFKTIKVPLVFIHHRDDACPPSPYQNVERMSKTISLISVSGGDPPQSGPCDPQSPHGYFGRDAPVVQAIRNWMLGREFVRDIK